MPVLSTVAAACARAWGFTSGFFYNAPIPSLFLDFASTTTLDSRITFTRATNGTFFNSSGVLSTASSGVARFDHRLEGGVWVNKGLLIEEQRTNICLRSEEFNTTWSTAQGTVTANQIAAPDGTTTADRFLENTVNSGHNVNQSFTIDMTSANYSASAFVKGGLGRVKGFIQLINNTFTSGITASYDLSTETISAAAGGSAVLLSSSIQNVGDGWYRLIISGRTGVSGSQLFLLYTANDAGGASYVGDVTKGLYFWGAQLEAGAFPTSYIKTTTASVTRNGDVAVMTGAAFSSWYNATEGSTFWQGDVIGIKPSTATSHAFSISDNSFDERIIVAPSGSTGAGFFTVVTDGAVSQASLSTPNPAVILTAFQTYKHSFAYKVNDFAASLDGGAVATDTSGTLPTVDRMYIGLNANGGGEFLNGHIAEFYYWPTRLPNNGLRFLSANGYDAEGLSLILNFDQTTALDPRITFTRATNGTFFNSSGVLSTATSGAARFDHRLESGVWVNKGLLIEEQRTNLSLRSEEIDNAYWAKVNVTVTANNIAAPDGTTTAERLLETTTNGVHLFNTNTPFAANMLSTNFTASVFVKGGLGRTRGAFGVQEAGTSNFFIVNYNISSVSASAQVNGTGVSVGTAIQDVGNGWYRVSVSGRTGANATHQILCYIADDTTTSYTGDVTKGLYFWGAQLEAGAFPTSYIKTTTASVTRNADVASMTSTNFSDWYNATEGTVFWQGDYVGISGGNLFSGWEISDNTATERLLLINQNSTGLTSTFIITDNASDVAAIVSPDPRVTAVTNQTYKTASAYKLNDIAHTLDGRTPGTDTSATLPTVDRLRIGCGNTAGTSNGFINGHIAKFYYWNTRKSNTFLQSITG